MSFKKYCLVLSALILVILCVACSSDEDGGSNNNNQNNEQTSGDQTEAEPFELSIMLNLHTPEVPSEMLQGLLEEATNTKLDIQWIPDSNYDERVKDRKSTNSLPQAFLVKTAQFVQFKDAIRDGQFWEIGPYLDDYENLSKLREHVLENQKVDDKLYSLYMGRPLSRNGIIYRKDWADNLDISTPTTTDEFYDMLRAFTEDDPNGSGEDDAADQLTNDPVLHKLWEQRR